jgi:phosphoglucosamine mutase
VNRLFGTDGIRGEAGQAPLDRPTLLRLGAAVAAVMRTETQRPARIVLGRDTRESGPELLRALAEGLARAGASVRSAGVVPTPAISHLARTGDFDVGVVISASHNPWHDNGVKLFGGDGMKLRDGLEAEIERELAAVHRVPAGNATEPPHDEEALRRVHADWLEQRGRSLGGLADLRVVADCANGAASAFAEPLFRALGAEVTVRHATPDGRNINEGCGAVHPKALCGAVAEAGADLGVAFDGDADRAVFCDASGRLVDGDNVLLMAADALSATGGLRGGGVVGTIMSNHGLDEALSSRGLVLIRERVGDRNVLARMLETGCNLGGEPSGHVIFLDDAPAGDGQLTALHVMSIMQASGRTLEELAAALPRTPQVLRNVRVRNRLPLDEVDGHAARMSRWTHQLAGRGRVVVRWSGTEPVVRVMAEGHDERLVGACVDDIASHLMAVLGERT